MRTRPAAWALRRVVAAALGALFALALAPAVALAHGSMSEQPPEAQVPEPAMGSGGGMGGGMDTGTRRMTAHLEVLVPKETTLGRSIRVQAVLTGPKGDPIPGMTIVFEADAVWGDEFQGHMVIGTAVTNRKGVATLTTQPRSSGAYEVAAYFPGDGRYGPVMEEADLEVRGDAQLYSPSAGIRVPWLNLWVLAGVIALVWSMYFLVGLRVLAISRASYPAATEAATDAVTVASNGTTRREFLGRLLPVGAQAGIAAFGTGLVALVARSPRTHGNLMAPPSTVDYHRTPVARVGQMTEMRAMPEPLDREVSFSKEILPILLASGGPHVVTPESSPPPGGLRLDSYEQVMAREGVVVPGKPQESEMIAHLLSAGMQMPPSIPPLPDEQIRLFVTWIHHGAKDD